MKILLFIISFFIGGCAAINDAHTDFSGPAPTKPCPQFDATGDYLCYAIDVAENPEQQNGRRLSLEVIVLRAHNQEGAEDPLFVIPGGPGQSATRAVGARNYFISVFDGVRRNRDIVLIAPRGTAGANELRLSPNAEALFDHLDTIIPATWARDGRRALSAKAELSQYTTSRIVDDLEATRRAIGYKKINLYGTSYGSRVAQLYAIRYPENARAIILKAPLPPSVPIPLSYTANSERALRLHFDHCRKTPTCAAAFPNLDTDFSRLMETLAASPARIEITNPMTGEAQNITVSDTAFGLLLRSIMMNAGAATNIPALIHNAANGDFAMISQLVPIIRSSYATQLASGMALSVIAAEDIPLMEPKAVAQDANAGFLKGAVGRGIQEAAKDWPAGAPGPDRYSFMEGDTPTLIIAGELDPATPPEYGALIAAALSNARLVVFSGGAHSASNFSGIDRMMTDFIESADPFTVDISPATDNKLLPPVTPES